jgi:ubiquinone/menaquinone biosynthesis C-methylase UbiE
VKNTADYHLRELEIALNRHDPRNVLPPHIDHGSRVLDVGCGAGQTLIASCPGCSCVGVDIDMEALNVGRRLTQVVSFTCADAEKLPFAGNSFDWVLARVSLPFTNIARSLSESHRVLRPNGCLWAVMQRPSLPFRTGKLREPRFYAFAPYLLFNSVLFNCTGISIPFIDRKYRGYQTRRGMEKALVRAGFRNIEMTANVHLVIVAKKGT